MIDSKQHHIVIAADASGNSLRAVAYVGEILGQMPGFKITLLNVIHAPDEDFFPSERERDRWIKAGRVNISGQMSHYRDLLIACGCHPDRVHILIVERDGPSLAHLILTELTRLDAGTVVVGRQGLSRKEEFLFGSVSRQIVSHFRDGAVWVVQ